MKRIDSTRLRLLVPALMATVALAACGSSIETTTSTSTSATATSTSSASTGTGAGGAGGESTGSTGSTGTGGSAVPCASTFGTELTSAFGRLDGVVTAVVEPKDQQCAGVNSDHLVIEAKMNGAIYRLVVNIQSDFGDPEVLYLVKEHALPPPAWSEGWHTGITVDYVATFGVHSTDPFKPYPLAELADLLRATIPLGEKISVYALSSGGSSAHEVHRNKGTTDGAIVLDPEGASPKVLLFHFANQTF